MRLLSKLIFNNFYYENLVLFQLTASLTHLSIVSGLDSKLANLSSATRSCYDVNLVMNSDSAQFAHTINTTRLCTRFQAHFAHTANSIRYWTRAKSTKTLWVTTRLNLSNSVLHGPTILVGLLNRSLSNREPIVRSINVFALTLSKAFRSLQFFIFIHT